MANQRERWLYGAYFTCADDDASDKIVKTRVTHFTIQHGLERVMRALDSYIKTECSCAHGDTKSTQYDSKKKKGVPVIDPIEIVKALKKGEPCVYDWFGQYTAIAFCLDGSGTFEYSAKDMSGRFNPDHYEAHQQKEASKRIDAIAAAAKKVENAKLAVDEAAKSHKAEQAKAASLDVQLIDGDIEGFTKTRDEAQSKVAYYTKLADEFKRVVLQVESSIQSILAKKNAVSIAQTALQSATAALMAADKRHDKLISDPQPSDIV